MSAVTVTGPGADRTAPTVETGLSLAQYLATRPGAPTGAFYVRENGTTRYIVERGHDRVVETQART